MSRKYETFLQDQINAIEVKVSQLQGLTQALLKFTTEHSMELEVMDNAVFSNLKDIQDIKKSLAGEYIENHRDSSKN